MSTSSVQEVPIAKVVSLLVVGLITFGIAPILVRFATDIEPIALAMLRTVFSVLFLLPFWLVKRQKYSSLKKQGVNMWLMVAAGICLGLHFSFWIASLHYTSVASASVLVTMHPVMLIVAESLIFKRRFRALVWIGVFVSFTGSALLGLADDVSLDAFPQALLGNGLAFTAAVIFVAYFMLGRKIRQHTEWIDYVFYVYGYAAVTCLILTIIWVGGFPVISYTALMVGVALAIGPTILGHGSMNYAVKYISPTLLSTLILSEAIFAAIAAYFIFDEMPTILSIGAMFVILAGVTMTWVKKVQPPKN